MATTKIWNQLEIDCPIKLDRIKNYAQEMESQIPRKIDLENLDECKSSVLDAKRLFECLIATLIQTLYDPEETLKKSEDKVLFALLLENLSRYLKKLDDDAFNYVVKLDEPDPKKSLVGVSRISSFANILETALDSVIYETILKSTSEWKNFKETEYIKRDKRTFLYILFNMLHVTMSVVGGLTRDKSNKKGAGYLDTIQSVPNSWQSLMTKKGGDVLKEGYKEQTGIDLNDLDHNLKELYDDFEGQGGEDDDTE